MKMFFIYYSRFTNTLLTVHRIHSRAAAHARQIQKAVAVIDVDIDTAPKNLTTFHNWKGGTIECVTADLPDYIEGIVDPEPLEIGEMIDRV